MRERVVLTLTSSLLLAGMTNGLKYSVREPRPDTGSRNSFPSGHTATAFMGAELVRMEYGNTVGTVAYAFATGIALSRVYNDRHWLNDVVAGAGVGILSTQIAYLLLPAERKLLKWNKDVDNVFIVQTYDGRNCSLAVSLNF